jgi:hypothetical protein
MITLAWLGFSASIGRLPCSTGPRPGEGTTQPPTCNPKSDVRNYVILHSSSEFRFEECTDA